MATTEEPPTLIELKRNRRFYVDQVNSVCKRLEVLLTSHENEEIVIECKRTLNEHFLGFKITHRALLDSMTEPAEMAEFEEQYNSVCANQSEINNRVAEWLATELEPTQPDIQDNLSTSGTVVSVNAKEAEAKRRLSEIKLKQAIADQELQRTEEELERRTRELRRQRELLRHQSELAQAREEEAILKESDDTPVNRPVIAGTVVQGTPATVRTTEHQDGLTQIANMMQEGFNLPKRELYSFSGDILNFCQFLHNFELNIEKRFNDNQLRLSYLIQYCEGESKELVQDCIYLGDDGYAKAIQLLKSRYGKPHIVAQSYVAMLINGPSIKANDVKSLLRLSLDMSRANITLTQLGFTAEINNSENLKRIVSRLPNFMKSKWVEKAYRINESGRAITFKDLSDFISERASIENSMYGLELNQNFSQSSTVTNQSRGNYLKPSYRGSESRGYKATSLVTSVENKPKCRCCEGTCRKLAECEKFKRFSLQERKFYVRKNRLCNNCFVYNHMSRDCRRDSCCDVTGCAMKHNTLLHEWFTRSGDHTTSPSVTVTVTGSSVERKVFLRILPVKIVNGDKVVETYALLDNGSDVSLCDNRLLSMLGVTGKPRSFTINSVNNSSSVEGYELDLEVRSMDDRGRVNIRKAWSVPNLPISLRGAPDNNEIRKWDHLRGINIPEIDSREVMLLLGSDSPEVFWSLEERRGKRGEPYGVRSLLGWTIQGPAASAGYARDACINFQQSQYEVLSDQLTQMYDKEFKDPPSSGKLLSQNDKRALSIMEDTVQMENGHYKLALPWEEEKVTLPNNMALAEARLGYLGKKFKKDPELKEKYMGQITEYITQGYASKVIGSKGSPGKVWYLPHHGVTNINKPGKLRIVFDCAAKYKGVSLNDKLMQGPDLTNSLVGVLIRFRQESVALVADIESMFHKVLVSEADRSALRFLWWRDGNPDNGIEEYQMNVFVFGAKPSPSCAAFSLRRTAEDNKQCYGELVVNTVLNDFYVDDLLKSTANVDQAIHLAFQLRELLAKGGFRLTKWSSNSREVIASIPVQERAAAVKDIALGESLPSGRALGISWNIEEDSFNFQIKRDENSPATRRGILSVIASLYDPIGLAAPATLEAKQLLQKLCRQNLGWDEPIAIEDSDTWCQWLDDLQNLSEMKIPRCYKPTELSSVVRTELHMFSDASSSGYGACCYLRLQDTENNIHTTLVMGKSRVAPIKTVTIPRLELTAAVVACQLYSVVANELEYKIDEVVFWTDSTIVLAYIKNKSKRFKTFVANRIATIHEHTAPRQWRHVPTRQNPADLASRGINPSDIPKLQQWINGPAFLREYEDAWPSMGDTNAVMSDDLEVKKECTVHIINTEESVLDAFTHRYSSWFGLQRGTVWLLRFKAYCVRKYLKRSVEVFSGAITLNEVKAASCAIISYIQGKVYRDEIDRVTKHEYVLKSSRLEKLVPIYDGNLLKVGGRLNMSSLPDCMVHPIILPHSHFVTSLIVKEVHVANGHVGPRHTLSCIQQKYWIVKGIQLCKNVIGNCMMCKRMRQPPMGQQMASLPPERLTPDKPPFAFTCIDYFGPFLVKVKRSQVKRYGCLFTCMTTRAVHIEVAHSLDTQSLLCALSRFIARRGKPEKVFSDNGTNLVSGNKELKQSVREFNSTCINNNLIQKDIEWIFNPPTASHMGGVWERLVRSVRAILNSLTSQQVLTDESLVTFMTEVEGILNSRPITGVNEEVRDPEALTPNHMLLLSPNGSLPPGVFKREDSLGVRRWRQIHYMANIFWRRWVKDYLPSLQIRQTWQRPHRCVRVNDIVMLVDENCPRGQWPLGIVIGISKGRDNLVRSCKVKTAKSEYIRPIHKLCLLEGSD